MLHEVAHFMRFLRPALSQAAISSLHVSDNCAELKMLVKIEWGILWRMTCINYVNSAFNGLPVYTR
jgi:hypothetical protein